MKDASDSAFVVSVHYESLEGATRINLKWKGHHEISDFDFDHLGEVIGCSRETENAGWVDRPAFKGFAWFQLAARIAIRSCDPPIARSYFRRRLDPLAATFKALNGFRQ